MKKNKLIFKMLSAFTITLAIGLVICMVYFKNGNAEGSQGGEQSADDSTYKNSQGVNMTGVNGNNSDEDESATWFDDDETAVLVDGKYDNVSSGILKDTGYVHRDYFDNTIFIGDSRVVGLVNSGFIKEKNTFAEVGINHIDYMNKIFTDEVTGVTGTIFDIVEQRLPERIYVALGVNGVAFFDEEQFHSTFLTLVKKLQEASPSSTIIIESILPVNEKNLSSSNGKLNNMKIDIMNGYLMMVADETRVFYLDMSSIMKDDNNNLISAYDSGDGLHFSFTGYGVIFDAICRHGVS